MLPKALIRRIEKLERAITPRFTPEPRVRFDPRTRQLLDPIPKRPFIPEPHFENVADWEAYNQETRAALMRHMPEGN